MSAGFTPATGWDALPAAEVADAADAVAPDAAALALAALADALAPDAALPLELPPDPHAAKPAHSTTAQAAIAITITISLRVRVGDDVYIVTCCQVVRCKIVGRTDSTYS